MIKHHFPIDKNKEEFSFFKDELEEKIAKEFAGPMDLSLKTLQIACLTQNHTKIVTKI